MINLNESRTGGKMTTDEDDEMIEVNFATYKRYVMDYFGGWCFIFCAHFFNWILQAIDVFLAYSLGSWGNDPE